MVMRDEVEPGGSAGDEADTFPLWTVRFTWSVLDFEDQPTYTYTATGSETEALDRAAFALDRYDNSGTRRLISAHVKCIDGWSKIPRPSSSLARHGYLHAFQQPPKWAS